MMGYDQWLAVVHLLVLDQPDGASPAVACRKQAWPNPADATEAEWSSFFNWNPFRGYALHRYLHGFLIDSTYHNPCQAPRMRF